MKTKLISQRQADSCMRLLLSMVAVVAAALFASATALAADKPEIKGPPVPSLITETPEEGFALAVKLSQKGVVFTQTDAKVRGGLREQYANDPDSLVAVSHVIAVHFQTVAAANDYWHK